MERLIDANELKAWFLRPYSNEETYSNVDICSRIDSAPTVDPVKRGHWIREPNCWYRCSECGSHYPSIADNMDYHYCPNCGAKMTLD